MRLLVSLLALTSAISALTTGQVCTSSSDLCTTSGSSLQVGCGICGGGTYMCGGAGASCFAATTTTNPGSVGATGPSTQCVSGQCENGVCTNCAAIVQTPPTPMAPQAPTIPDVPKPLASHRARALSANLRKRIEACPVGLQGCEIAGSLHGGIQCVDTRSELSECGGCLNSGGRDCEKLTGVSPGSVSCHESQCVIHSCQSGYTLSARPVNDWDTEFFCRRL